MAKKIDRNRRAKRQVKTQESGNAKLVRVPTDYFDDGYYYGARYARTVIAVGLANALVFE